MNEAATAETVAALWFTAFFAFWGLAIIVSGALKRRPRSRHDDS